MTKHIITIIISRYILLVFGKLQFSTLLEDHLLGLLKCHNYVFFKGLITILYWAGSIDYVNIYLPIFLINAYGNTSVYLRTVQS